MLRVEVGDVSAAGACLLRKISRAR